MKKDTKWLKKTIQTTIDKKTSYYDPTSFERKLAYMFVMGLINQLDEPETISDEFLKSHSDWVTLCHTGEQVRAVRCDVLRDVLVPKVNEPEITEEQAWNEEIARLSDYLLRNFEKEIGGDRNYETPVDAAIRLLGEKRKPVIPQFVADWIELAKEVGLSLVGVMDLDTITINKTYPKVEFQKLKGYMNYGKNQKKVARAWLDGYEVEKEQLYHVKDNNETLLCKVKGEVMTVAKAWYIGYEQEFYHLTEKEIKEYDERYWSFSEPVEEGAE